MVMLFSQARDCPVVSAEEATELGRVTGLTLDARTARVGHLRLSGASGRGGTALPWSEVHAAGPDAVIVRSGSAGRPVAELPPHVEALGARVLTDLGDEQGTVKDIAFDPVTGRVVTVYTALGALDGQRVIGLGPYALVVRAAVCDRG
ncbi:PRC-barrel domain-containing protein [Streptomyces sp. NPDC049577]|uniref:PRC-barrel domain-containing protein n=1 Tax=Streptomyces sp. NPDC049577 TaxID=3155153 RepID=UPI0034419020